MGTKPDPAVTEKEHLALCRALRALANACSGPVGTTRRPTRKQVEDAWRALERVSHQ